MAAALTLAAAFAGAFAGTFAAFVAFRKKGEALRRENIREAVLDLMGADPDEDSGFVPEPSDEEYEEMNRPVWQEFHRKIKDRARREAEARRRGNG